MNQKNHHHHKNHNGIHHNGQLSSDSFRRSSSCFFRSASSFRFRSNCFSLSRNCGGQSGLVAYHSWSFAQSPNIFPSFSSRKGMVDLWIAIEHTIPFKWPFIGWRIPTMRSRQCVPSMDTTNDTPTAPRTLIIRFRTAEPASHIKTPCCSSFFYTPHNRPVPRIRFPFRKWDTGQGGTYPNMPTNIDGAISGYPISHT